MHHSTSSATATLLAPAGWPGDAIAAGERLLLSAFLERLRRMLDQRGEHAAVLSPGGLRLLDHAIFSTYCDCRILGGQAIAQGLIEKAVRSAAEGATLDVGTAVETTL